MPAIKVISPEIDLGVATTVSDSPFVRVLNTGSAIEKLTIDPEIGANTSISLIPNQSEIIVKGYKDELHASTNVKATAVVRN